MYVQTNMHVFGILVLICGICILLSNIHLKPLPACRTVFADLGVRTGGLAQEVKITAEPVIYTDKDNNRVHDVMLLQLPSPSDIPPIALPDCDYRPKM